MQYEQFVYPAYDAPLIDAYGGRFESVFVILHPFIRMPDELSWRAARRYPTGEQILCFGSKVAWMEVASETGLSNCAHVNQALLTATGAVAEHLCDPAGCDALESYVKNRSTWMPAAGMFEPLLYNDFLAAFEEGGAMELIFVPEFPKIDPVQTRSVADLKRRRLDFPDRGSLVAPDASFLFTVDWDSFFTLFYGSRAFVTKVARARNLEGFFAAPATEHGWFNYSMGCATVTLSPEHWSTL